MVVVVTMATITAEIATPIMWKMFYGFNSLKLLR